MTDMIVEHTYMISNNVTYHDHRNSNVDQSITRTGFFCFGCPHTCIVFSTRSNTTELSVMQQSLPEPKALV